MKCTQCENHVVLPGAMFCQQCRDHAEQIRIMNDIQLNLAKISLSLNDIAASLRMLSSRPQSL